MKCFIWIFLLQLKYGVFGAGEKKAVTEGDHLTLQTGFSEIQSDDRIVWLYGSDMIARIDKAGGVFDTYDVADGRFSGKLELDNQTGSLIIKDIRIKNAGDYQLEKKGVTAGKFMVTVYARLPTPDIGFSDCPQTPAGSSKICAVQCSVQTVGLVTLSWYKGNNLVSSEISDTCRSTSLRLEVDYDDKNIYSCMVNNPISNQTKHPDISGLCHKCAATGLSPAAVAGIVISVLLLAAAVAGVAGVMYFLRPRITNLPNQTWSVPEGDDVPLNPETEIQRGDKIQWLFGAGDALIAEIKVETRKMKTHDGPDERFKKRLKQGETTGSLTIKFITTKHSGLYTLKIRRGRETFYKRFIVSVSERKITVTEGYPVTLKPVTELNKDDIIHWQFGDEVRQTLIAEFKVESGKRPRYGDVADERFRDRLQLDETTGSLTIKNTNTEHSGVYKLEIRSSSGVTEQTFIVTVKVEEKFLKGGDSVTLKTDTEIQRDDLILWMFGYQDKLIAQMKGGTVEIYDDDVKRFRDRLKLDETGSLTITKIEAEQTGLYKLLIISSRGETLYKRFKVLVHYVVTPKEPKEKSLMKEKTDPRGNRRNESATVEIPLLKEGIQCRPAV